MMRTTLSLLLCLAVLSAAAQDDARYRILVALESSAPLAAEDCADALSAAISRSPSVGEVRRAAGDGELCEEAGKLGFDLALYACILPSDKGAYLWWRIYSPLSGDEIGYGAVDSEPPSARDLQDAFWLDLAASLESAIASFPRSSDLRLVVKGPPGAIVRGLGPEPVILDPEGGAEIRMAAPATYSWSASARGYDRSEGKLAVLGPRASELTIDMRRQFRWNIDAGLYNGAFLDLWASYRLLDDRLFLRAGLRQYLVGLSLPDARPGVPFVGFTSLPLIQPGLGAGILFGKAGQPLRSYAGALATSRIAFSGGAGLFADPVAPLCLEPFGGLEWRPLRICGFFAELYAGLYLFADERLFAASARKSDGPSPLDAYGDGWVFNVPNLRFGARFYL